MSKNLGQRPLRAEDVAQLAEQVRDLGPARFQEIEFWGPETLALGFYSAGLVWLELGLDPRAPSAAWRGPDARPKTPFKSKPLTLFIRSHFLGHILYHAEAPPEFGRVLRVYFPLERWLEIRLFPRGVNVIAHAEGKSVALHKPQPLKEVDLEQEYEAPATEARPAPVAPSAEDRAAAAFAKQIAKLEKTRQKISDELDIKRDQIWQSAGEWLREHQSLRDAPAEFAACFDLKQSFSWNINRCFEKAKAQRVKSVGTKQRLSEIERQLAELRAGGPKAAAAARVTEKPGKSLLATARAQGRTIELAPGQVFYVGKSAADNLRLLRAAKPWHLWMHLKDYPGSHGILQRNKGQEVASALLHTAANHLLRMQFGDKASKYDGDKFAILVAECRHVRPIKGDRLGRVTHSESQTISHRFEAQKS